MLPFLRLASGPDPTALTSTSTNARNTTASNARRKRRGSNRRSDLYRLLCRVGFIVITHLLPPLLGRRHSRQLLLGARIARILIIQALRIALKARIVVAPLLARALRARNLRRAMARRADIGRYRRSRCIRRSRRLDAARAGFLGVCGARLGLERLVDGEHALPFVGFFGGQLARVRLEGAVELGFEGGAEALFHVARRDLGGLPGVVGDAEDGAELVRVDGGFVAAADSERLDLAFVGLADLVDLVAGGGVAARDAGGDGFEIVHGDEVLRWVRVGFGMRCMVGEC